MSDVPPVRGRAVGGVGQHPPARVIDIRGRCRPRFVASVIADSAVECRHDVALIVPTRDDRRVVLEFLRRVDDSVSERNESWEVVVVDDSDDDTADLVTRWAGDRDDIHCLRRERGDRAGGLTGAVLRGLAACSAEVVVVAPVSSLEVPALLAAVAEPLLDERADVVVVDSSLGTQRPGGHGGLADRARRSLTAVVPASRVVSDPASELFGVRRGLVDSVELCATGPAVLLALLACTEWERVVEITPDGPLSPRAAVRGVAGAARLGGQVGRLTVGPSTRRSPHNGVARPGAVLVPTRAIEVETTTSAVGLRERAARTVIPLLLVAFFSFQAATVLRLHNGPFLDEGIYVTAGLRTLEGHGISDGYLGWFAGSLLWPVLSGSAFEVGGLDASRLLAAVFVTAGLGCAARTTRVMFGRRAAVLGLLAVALGGPVLGLAHLAVYDVIAVFGLALSVTAIIELGRSGHRGWVVAAAIGTSVAVLGKYPAGFFVPVLVLLVLVVRRRAGVADLGIYGAVCSAVLLMFFLPWRYQLAYFLGWRVGNNPSFGVTREMVEYEQLRYTAPYVALVILGVAAAARHRRGAAVVLGSALLLFPAYHVLTANAVSASKHVVFGIVIAMPVIGQGLSRLAGRRALRTGAVLAAITALGVVGLNDMRRLDRGWGDAEPGARYLAAHMRPGDRLLAPNAWQIMPFVYDHGVTDPASVIDAYGWAHATTPIDVCSVEWVVNTTNDNAWSDDFLGRMRACGSFVEVFRSSSSLTNLGRDLHYVTYQSEFVVYENTGGGA